MCNQSPNPLNSSGTVYIRAENEIPKEGIHAIEDVPSGLCSVFHFYYPGLLEQYLSHMLIFRFSARR